MFGLNSYFNRGLGGHCIAIASSALVPIARRHAIPRVSLRSRLGVATCNTDDPMVWSGLSVWRLVGADWRPDDGVLTQLAIEGFTGKTGTEHLRFFLAIRMENFW